MYLLNLFTCYLVFNSILRFYLFELTALHGFMTISFAKLAIFNFHRSGNSFLSWQLQNAIDWRLNTHATIDIICYCYQ